MDLCLKVLKSETPTPPPQTQQSFEAMVAFVCHLPAMHWTRSEGWTPDETTGCIKDHNKIIDYCKKVSGALSSSSSETSLIIGHYHQYYYYRESSRLSP